MAGRVGQDAPAIHMSCAQSAVSKLDTKVLAGIDWALVSPKLNMIVVADVSMWQCCIVVHDMQLKSHMMAHTPRVQLDVR